MLREITEEEYNEMVENSKFTKKLPHALMITVNEYGIFEFIRYNMLTSDIKKILNNYKRM